jgi:PIN domain nuclease of toxin-antitoxin system
VRVLLDTHAMLWWLRDDHRLSDVARSMLGGGSTELLWSLASSWEVAVKITVGKLDLGRPVERLFADLVTEQGVDLLPVGHEHCSRVAALPLHHRDPFDRMLVAQAQEQGVPLLSADDKLRRYDVDVLW